MLKLMEPVPLWMFGKTKDPSGFQIFVMPMDIGVCMVQHIMLYLPIVNISSKNIHARAHNFIDPFFGGIGTVIGIMHHIHSHTGHSNSHNDGKN